MVIQADVDFSVEKRPRRQHHGARPKLDADLRDRADDALALDQQVIDGLLKQPQVRLVFQHAADRGLVQNAIRLGAGGPHRRAFGAVQNAELDAALVGGQRHRAAHRIDLLDQMAFADAADGRVAAHLA